MIAIKKVLIVQNAKQIQDSNLAFILVKIKDFDYPIKANSIKF